MASADTKRSSATGWVIALIVVLLAGYLYIHNSHAALKVHSAEVTREDLISTISTNGKVEPLQDFQAHAPSPGTINKLFVSVGDHVRQGQELLRMDTADAQSKLASSQASVMASESALRNMQSGGTQDELLTAKADLASAQSQQKSAAATLNSIEALQAKGAASANEVAAARQRLSDAAARVAQLQSRINGRYSSSDLSAQRSTVEESRAALSAAQDSYSAFDIRAPFSGTVYSLPVSQYDFVNGGEALLDVADLTHLQVRAYFDEPEIGQLATGQTVKIVWDARPTRTWHGHISQAPTTVISYGTRSVGECLITVDDADGDLLPNTNVTVTVTTLQRFSVLSLPREALHTEDKVNYVFRIVKNHLVRTNVQVGVVNLTRVEIVSGLNAGDIVSLNATTEADLTDGLRVTVLP